MRDMQGEGHHVRGDLGGYMSTVRDVYDRLHDSERM